MPPLDFPLVPKSGELLLWRFRIFQSGECQLLPRRQTMLFLLHPPSRLIAFLWIFRIRNLIAFFNPPWAFGHPMPAVVNERVFHAVTPLCLSRPSWSVHGICE